MKHGREASGAKQEGANHGFDNDTTRRYDEAAASATWQRTLEWLDQ